MTSEIMIYCQNFSKSGYDAIHIKNYFKWLNVDYISFVDNKSKESKVFLFKYCYSTEEYYELLKLCNKYNLDLKEWNENNLIIIESKNSNLNKNIIINLRK